VSENDAKAHLEELLDSAEDYPNFVDYITALWERRETGEWPGVKLLVLGATIPITSVMSGLV